MKLNNETKAMAGMTAMVLLAYLLWNTPLLYPVKMFVVLLHEMSHGFAALLCGGRIVEIRIDPAIGGLCRFSLPPGFFRSLFVASAGYLGSMFWGSLILILGIRTRYDRHISMVIGLVVLLLTVLYVRQIFGILFCALFGLFMIAAARFLSDGVNDCLIRFLGMVSCLYALVDIKEDLIDRSGIGSDADRIAQLLSMPQLSIAIGIFFACCALVLLAVTLRIAAGGADTGPKTSKT